MELQEEFDWDCCIICQEVKKERLQCPVNASETHSRKEIGTTTENLKAFSILGADTSLTKYFKNKEITSLILERNKGKWHESCRLRFNSTKLNRLGKRSLEIDDDNDETSRRKSLRTIKNDPKKFPKKCFFDCGDESDKQILHAVTTFQVDRRVLKIATETNDSATLVKLSQGDMIAIEACYHANV